MILMRVEENPSVGHQFGNLCFAFVLFLFICLVYCGNLYISLYSGTEVNIPIFNKYFQTFVYLKMFNRIFDIPYLAFDILQVIIYKKTIKVKTKDF